eukprot:scaffold239150_cov50-Attheya_sp.AAC.3
MAINTRTQNDEHNHPHPKKLRATLTANYEDVWNANNLSEDSLKGPPALFLVRRDPGSYVSLTLVSTTTSSMTTGGIGYSDCERHRWDWKIILRAVYASTCALYWKLC